MSIWNNVTPKGMKFVPIVCPWRDRCTIYFRQAPPFTFVFLIMTMSEVELPEARAAGKAISAACGSSSDLAGNFDV